MTVSDTRTNATDKSGDTLVKLLTEAWHVLAEKRIDLELTPEARTLLADKGYDPHYGARPLKRAIQRLVQDPLAMKILEGEFPEGTKVQADARVSGDALEFRKN